MPYKPGWYQPRQDTGWGLIFRLNGILAKLEQDVESGDLEKWNLHLDRIYSNISYKKPEEKIYDDKGNVVDIKFDSEDVEIITMFNTQIAKKKKEIALANIELEDNEKKIKIKQLRDKLYQILFKKDVWIRKKMFVMNLYLKEVEHDPRKAIYGG